MPMDTAIPAAVLDPTLIPEHTAESIGLTVAACVRDFFSDPAVMADYLRWRKEYRQKKRLERTEEGQ